MDNYYNTNKLTGKDLSQANYHNLNQEEKVLSFFRYQSGRDKNRTWSPFDVLQYEFDNQVPITSIRRALTNLTSQGRLTKTDIMVKGPYGSPCHTWRLK